MLFLSRPFLADPTPLQLFTSLLGDLRDAVAQHGPRDRAFAPLGVLIWAWLRRVETRLARLIERVESGHGLPPLHPRQALGKGLDEAPGQASGQRPAPAAPGLPAAQALRAARQDGLRLPRGLGWLSRDVPGARLGITLLEQALRDPRVLALVAREPRRFARILRPLCRALRVPREHLPEPLRPLPRPRRPAAATVTKVPTPPSGGPRPRRSRRDAATLREMRLRKSRVDATGFPKPGFVKQSDGRVVPIEEFLHSIGGAMPPPRQPERPPSLILLRCR